MNHPDDFNQLVQRGDGIYTVMRPLNLLGVQFGRRMVIIQGKNGNLMLQSPFIPEPDTMKQIFQLGNVTDIVVPTVFHDTFLDEVVKAYPDACYHVVQGAEKHLPKHVAQRSTDSGLAQTSWSDVLETFLIGGMPKVNESIFYHRPSKSLLVSDLFFNRNGLGGCWLNVFSRLMGFADQPSPSRLFRAMISDSEAFSSSLQQVMTCDFDQILTSHFCIVEKGGKAILDRIIRS